MRKPWQISELDKRLAKWPRHDLEELGRQAWLIQNGIVIPHNSALCTIVDSFTSNLNYLFLDQKPSINFNEAEISYGRAFAVAIPEKFIETIHRPECHAIESTMYQRATPIGGISIGYLTDDTIPHGQQAVALLGIGGQRFCDENNFTFSLASLESSPDFA